MELQRHPGTSSTTARTCLVMERDTMAGLLFLLGAVLPACEIEIPDPDGVLSGGPETAGAGTTGGEEDGTGGGAEDPSGQSPDDDSTTGGDNGWTTAPPTGNPTDPTAGPPGTSGSGSGSDGSGSGGQPTGGAEENGSSGMGSSGYGGYGSSGYGYALPDADEDAACLSWADCLSVVR